MRPKSSGPVLIFRRSMARMGAELDRRFVGFIGALVGDGQSILRHDLYLLLESRNVRLERGAANECSNESYFNARMPKTCANTRLSDRDHIDL